MHKSAVTMATATKKAKMDARKVSGNNNSPDKEDVQDLRETVAKLRNDLDSEHQNIKQLKREKSQQLKATLEQEQTKASVVLKDLRAKMLVEKAREVDLQKDALHKKFDLEMNKVVKQKDGDLAKVRSDLAKCQDELAEVSHRGLSGSARGAFEAERAKLLADMQELRSNKRQLEEAMKSAQEGDKQRAYDLRSLRDSHNKELARRKREADMEVKKLLEELKAKDKSIEHLTKDSGAMQAASTIAKQQDLLISLASEMATWDREKRGKSPSVGSTTSSSGSAGSGEGPPDPGGRPPDADQSDSSFQAVTELRVKLHKTEDVVSSLMQDKAELLKHMKDFEKKFRQSQDKNRKFLEKNMDLTNVNRNLEEKIKKLSEENTKLKSSIDKSKKETQKLSNRLTHDKQGKAFLDSLTEELEEQRQSTADLQKTMEALKLACAEKDRRIELLAHRRKKQRANKQLQKVVRFQLPQENDQTCVAAGIKETYYGYDEDTKSVDSEHSLSMSSRMSSSRVSLDTTAELDDASDDVFEEFTREEFEKNYQRLAKEHLELEKSFALLQAQHGHSQSDPQREIKNRCQLECDLLDAQSKIEDLTKIVTEKGKKSEEKDTTWLEEKEMLNRTIRKLKEKITLQSASEQQTQSQVQDLTEQNEVLEFRLLELEECNEKLSEEVGHAIALTTNAELTPGGLLQIYAADNGVVEVHVSQLKQQLLDLKNNKATSLHQNDKVLLLQARATLDIAEKKLNELHTTQGALKTRIAQLETEKAELLATATGLDTDLILEYEHVRNKLIEADLKTNLLKSQIEELKKVEAVYQYKEECSDRIEDNYRTEIATLKRQLSSTTEGRDLESALWEEKIEQLKGAEQKLQELKTENSHLQTTIKDLQREVGELTEQLETQSMTESDKDTNSQLHDLKIKIMAHEKSENELMEKNEVLEQELSEMKLRLQEYEQNEAELTEQNMSLQDELESFQKRCDILQQELETTEDELENMHRSWKSVQQDVELSHEKNTSLEEELRLACLNIEQLKTSQNGASLGDTEKDTAFDTAKVLKQVMETQTSFEDNIELNDEIVEQLQNEMESLRDEIDLKDMKIVELKKYKDVLEREEEDLDYLKEHIEMKDQEIDELTQMVHRLEKSDEEAAEKILELLETKDQLTARVDVLEAQLQDGGLTEDSRRELDELRKERDRLESQVQELEVTNKDLAEHLTSLQEQHDRHLDHERDSSDQDYLPDINNELAHQLGFEDSDVSDKSDEKETEPATEPVKSSSEAEPKHLIDRSSEERNGFQEDTEGVKNTKPKSNVPDTESGCFVCNLKEHQDLTNEITQYKQQLDELLLSHHNCNISEHKDILDQVQQYKDSIQELQVEIKALKELTDDDNTAIVEDREECESELLETIKDLEDRLETSQIKFDEAHSDFDEIESELYNRIKALEQRLAALQEPVESDNSLQYEDRVAELEKALALARDQLEETGSTLKDVESEKSKRIEILQERVDSMESNERRLSETIESLKDIERRLGSRSDDENEVSDTDVVSGDSKQNLKMENVEALEARITELVSQLEKYESEAVSKEGMAPPSGKVEKFKVKIVELQTTLEQMSNKESELTETIYQMQMENQELQEHIDELIEEKDGSSAAVSPRESSNKPIVELKDRISALEKENSELKDQLFRSKLDRLDTISEGDEMENTLASAKDLQNRINELEKSEVSLKSQIEISEEQIQALRTELERKIVKEGKLLAKLDILEQSEDKLMEQLDIMEEQNHKLNEELGILKQTRSTKTDDVYDSKIESLKLQVKIEELQNNEKALVQEIESLRERMTFERLDEKEELELVQLRNKVDILLDTEEKLIDRLQGQEGVELKLREEISALKSNLAKSETEVVVQRMRHVDKQTDLESAYNERRVNELELNEKGLKEQINTLEKSEIELLAKVAGLNSSLTELEKSNADLHDQITKLKHTETAVRHKISELERENISMHTQLKDLESQKKELVSTLEAVKLSSEQRILHQTTDDIQNTSVVFLNTSVPQITVTHHDTSQDFLSGNTSFNLLETWGSYTPLNPSDIEKMSREEMISKLHELEQMEKFHRTKIKHLTENLNEFRNAVEVVAVTMETDSGIPVVKYKPKVRDAAFEAHVQELVKSETSMKLRVMELEKRDTMFKHELDEAEAVLKEQEQDYRDEIDELEEELNEARKNEARLKNKLQYGCDTSPDTPALSKIQHLEELVFDLETSERKLKRRLQESQHSEDDLKARLDATETSGRKNGISKLRQSFEEKEKVFELEQQLRQLEGSEKDLKAHLALLQEDDTTEKLAKRVSELQRSEKGLKLKVELLEAEQDNSSMSGAIGTMLDTPEDILKQRIQQLEQMERHLKQQVIELEKDSEELHQIARGDKNTIHDISVQLRELQLSEKGLKEQMHRCEMSESHLQMTVDDLHERVEEAEARVVALTGTERSVRGQLAKMQHTETDLALKLENTKDDLQSTESKLKKRIEELQKDKRTLRDKTDELTDRIGDLEGAELTLKQKLRNIENNETQLKGRLREFEVRDGKNEQRKTDLEHLNESLNDTLHKLEEEKANLLYSLSEMELSKEEHNNEGDSLKGKIRMLERKVSDHEYRKSDMEKRLDEFTAKEVKLQSKLGERERNERELKEKLTTKEKSEGKLQKRVQALEVECVSSEGKVKSANTLEKQISFLQGQIDYHQRTLSQVDEENNRLKDKIRRYEFASQNKSMSQIPSADLTELRLQVSKLADTENTISRLERSEKSLSEVVAKLRDGKDACGHEFQLSEMKAKMEEYNILLQAHELLKNNHADTKGDLADLQKKMKNGDLSVKEAVAKATKCIQVSLADSFHLRGLTPEFKNALKSLSARYPQAYDEFVRQLQPTERQVSHVRVQQAAAPATMATTDESIVPQFSGNTSALPSGMGRRRSSKPQQDDTKDRGALIGELVSAMPLGDRKRGESPFWHEVEEKKSDVGPGISDEYWAELERNMGDTDDMMLTINFGEEDEVESVHGRPESARSLASSSSIPPLPASQPPPYRRSHSPGGDSYYLPSADEASELVDEDDGLGSMSDWKRGGSLPPRGKSLDRDVDYVEGTLPTLGMGLPQRKKKKPMSTSLDSIPDDSGFHDVDMKILKEKIAYLENQMRGKDKELEVAKVTHHELQAKIAESNQISDLKNKLNEKENQLSLEKTVNQDQMDKLSRTNQQLLQVKAELNQVKAKITPESSVTLQLKGPDETSISQIRLKTQLEKKERELTAKTNEVDRLGTELRRWQEDSRSAKDDKHRAEHDLSTTQSELQTVRGERDQLCGIQKHYDTLRAEHKELLSKSQHLEKAGEEKSALEKIVLKLRGQLSDLERIDLERSDLENKVKALEAQLKEKTTVESQVTKENAKMRHIISNLKTDHTKYGQMEQDYNMVRSKYDEMEQIKSKAQTAITPLRAKVLRLANKCKTKDELLQELAMALRSSGEHSDLLQQTDRALAHSADDEYNRPISPLTVRALDEFEMECQQSSPVPPSRMTDTSQPSKVPPPTYRRYSTGAESSASELFDSSLEGIAIDNMLDHMLQNGAPPKRPPRTKSKKSHQRGRSADGVLESSETGTGNDDSEVQLDNNEGFMSDDSAILDSLPPQLSLQPVTQLNNGMAGTKPSNGHHGPKYTSQLTPQMDTYRAVKDYEPEHFSRSGHQRLELPLKEGDVVKVLGPVDERGYFEAQVHGKVGLVPATYLLPIPNPPPRSAFRRNRPANLVTGHADNSPEHILNMHTHLQRAHTPSHYVPAPQPPLPAAQASLTHPVFARGAANPVSPRSPQQPSHPAFAPPLVNGAATNGHISPLRAPALPRSQATGPLDPPSNLRIQRVVGEHSLLLAWVNPELDELARNHGTVVRGYKIYINSKDRQTVPSPHMTKALIEKLNLRRPQSFSIQAVGENGRMSRLTDVTMFEDVLPEREEGESSIGDGDMSSVMSSCATEPGDRRVFMAIYDYVPSEHSPDTVPGQQLPFSAGDMIVTYGNVRPDGFYHGKIQGKRGFVPASFIEEVAILRSRGRRSASGSSVASQSFFSPPLSITGSECRPQSRGGSRPHSRGESQLSLYNGSRPGSQQSLHGSANSSQRKINTQRV